MSNQLKSTLARRVRVAKPRAKRYGVWDDAISGLGLRIHPSGRKVRIVQARIERRRHRIVITRHAEMEPAEARRHARDVLARIRAGGNPVDGIDREKRTSTVREFADEYLRGCGPYWKPSGRRTIRIYLKARILPALGRMRVDCDEGLERSCPDHRQDIPTACHLICTLYSTLIYNTPNLARRA